MKRKLLFWLTALVLLSLVITPVMTSFAQVQGSIFFPLVAKNFNPDAPTPTRTPPSPTATPDICAADPEVITHFSEVGYSWEVDCTGRECVLLHWTNFPRYDQSQRKTRISNELINYLGGGTLKKWPAGCANEANVSFNAENFTAVSLTDLQTEGLLFDPLVCSNPEWVTRPENPQVGVPWWVGGPNTIFVGAPLWSNQPDWDQSFSWKTLFTLNGTGWPILAGGEGWKFGAGCMAEALHKMESFSLDELTTQDLLDQGLLAWPRVP